MKSSLSFLLVALAFVSGCSKAASSAGPVAEILPVGTVAADFAAIKADGTQVKLSDFKGKPVLLDLWATWCGPCKISMPHIEELNKKLAGQGLVVLGICVADEKANFDKWMVKPEVPTSYLKAFDPAGRGDDGITSKEYKTDGIPALFLIGADGKIAYSAMGAGPDNEAALDKALAALGFKL